MDKDFDQWNIQKKQVNSRAELVLFHEKEIWWASIGLNVGSEQDGKNEMFERPVLVVKKFNQDVLLIVPLTSSNKPNRYYLRLVNGQENDSTVVLSQLKLISSKRLLRKIRMVSDKEFLKIVAKIKSIF